MKPPFEAANAQKVVLNKAVHEHHVKKHAGKTAHNLTQMKLKHHHKKHGKHHKKHEHRDHVSVIDAPAFVEKKVSAAYHEVAGAASTTLGAAESGSYKALSSAASFLRS